MVIQLFEGGSLSRGGSRLEETEVMVEIRGGWHGF
jgi:hypothetical protein